MATFEPVELFVADPHGEYEEFSHIVRSGCGNVRTAIDLAFGDGLDEAGKDELATVVCYPDQKAAAMKEDPAWLADIWAKLARVAVFLGICEWDGAEREDGDPDVAELAAAIQYTVVSRLHVMGDIYDRGPQPEAIMDELADYPNFDMQWGNHDILWMGAALGQPGCVCNAARICARYGNLSILEENYGMDLGFLRDFATRVYGSDLCERFFVSHNPSLSGYERMITSRIQKALAIIQFKVEAQIIAENPSFGLEHRNLLHRVDYAAGTVDVDGVTYPMLDLAFPTVDPADPYRLTKAEQNVLAKLVAAFTGCAKLQRHVALFLQKGSLYRIEGNTLLFHACVPLNPDGSLMQVDFYGKTYAGRALFDAVDGYVRDAYSQTDPVERKKGLDLIWYLWLGKGSPLFAKSKMATFELYFIDDKAAQKEVKNPFYSLLEDSAAMDAILADFGMDPARSRMICGHVPVKVKDGEDPVKCGGKVMIIDGGMSKPYRKNTGVAGFTVVSDSRGMRLATHQPFCGRDTAVMENQGLVSSWREV